MCLAGQLIIKVDSAVHYRLEIHEYGMAFTLIKGTEEVSVIPMDSLEYKYSKKCGNNFDEFIHDMYSGNLAEY